MNNHNIALMIREKIKLTAEPHFLALFKEKKLQVKLCGLFANNKVNFQVSTLNIHDHFPPKHNGLGHK